MSFRLCAPLRWRLHLVRHDCNPAHRGIVTTLLPGKGRWITTAQEVENTNVCHSQFLAEASGKAKWRDPNGGKGGTEATGEDLDTITDGKGKLSPTSSHLFKLILPLGHVRGQQPKPSSSSPTSIKPPPPPPPTVFLLHPSQPLSHVSRLILASLAPATPTISFRSTSPRGRTFQWDESTDVGDFIRDAARATKFTICIGAEDARGDERAIWARIPIEVPSFADRTRFLRRRLQLVAEELAQMETLKRQCDLEAHRGARRMALGGLGLLVVYWGAVARLTFWDLGWDVMEPVTYLSGLTMVIMSYLWFLYQGREVSYSSVLQRSVSARRETLYKGHGFDIDRWLDLVAEEKGLRKDISKIAEDYDERLWRERQEESERNEAEGERRNVERKEKAEAGLEKIPEERTGDDVARETRSSEAGEGGKT